MTHVTTDGNHAVRIVRNGEAGNYMAFAMQRYRNQFEYWYTIGRSYKTPTTAIRYAKRSLAEHGYALQEAAK